MYKISKYTFFTEDNKENILLYNAYCGRNSLCKVQDKNIVKCLLENKINGLDSSIMTELINRGIVVDYYEDENKKLYSQFLDVVVPRKLSLIINPTEQCNFRCKYCYESFNNGEMSKEVQEKVISYVRNNIHKYSGLNVSWFGGEPLLAMEGVAYLSEQFIKICSFYKVPYRANITTNGYCLDIDTFRKLIDLHVNYFQITIDGIATIHDKQRTTISGKGSYNRIIKS